jgi:hypothetical protein
MPEKLFIATPAYGRMVGLDYHTSMLETICALQSHGIATVPQYVCDSLVTRARNILAARFLATDCTHFLFLDADLAWKPEALIRLIGAMRKASDIECACALYPLKCVPIDFPVNLVKPLTEHPDVPFIEATQVPTGFLLLKRSAFQRFIETHPHRAAMFDPNVPGPQYAYFDTFIENGEYVSEDFGFSRMFRSAGGRIWVDPAPTLKHIGPHEFVGRLADYFTKTPVCPAGKG